MPAPLLLAKLRPQPSRPGLVSRPRLWALLDEAWQPGKKCILLSAPAGYGKTTLVTEWIARLQEKSAPALEPPLHIAWISLEEADNDPLRFSAYLAAALKCLSSPGHEPAGADALLFSTGAQPASVQDRWADLLNELDGLPGVSLLVLDDYFFMTHPEVHEIVRFLLLHLPPRMRLVVCTRTDPPLGLPQLRARDQMCELRMADLQFSLAEASEFLGSTMGLSLSVDDIAALDRRTEGWIAGLQMAALLLRGRPDPSQFIQAFSGSHRYIMEYLLEEVLGRQPLPVQSFLLRTSILVRLCAPLCDALLFMEDGGGSGAGGREPQWDESGYSLETASSILLALVRANLFLIPLDDGQVWYRYHHLFADLLRHRLRQSWESAAVLGLYQRASQWFEAQGLLADAIQQALLAPDLEFATALLEKHILSFFYQSEVAQVHQWLKALPESLIQSHPLLCAVYAASTALLPPYPPRSLPAAEKWMEIAECALAGSPPGSNLAQAFIVKIRSYWARFREDPPETVFALINQAFALLPPDLPSSAATQDSVARAYQCIHSALHTNLALTYWATGEEQSACQAFMQACQVARDCDDLFNESASLKYLIAIERLHGRLEQAAALAREALERYHSLGQRVPFSGEIGIKLAEILLEQNELAEAESLLKENLALAKWTMSHNILMDGQLAFARLEWARAHQAAAFTYLDRVERLSNQAAGLAQARRACLWLAWRLDQPDYLERARRWAQGRSLVEFDPHPTAARYGSPEIDWFTSVALARLVLAEANQVLRVGNASHLPDLAGLLAWLDRQVRAMQACGWAHWEIQLRLIECQARCLLADRPGALITLQVAVELAEPGGYVRVFIDEGEPLRELLAELRAGTGSSSAYLDRLLKAFPYSLDRAAPAPHPPATGPHGAHLPAHPLVSDVVLAEPLTPREREVLGMICQGLSNAEIAAALFVSLNTVKKHTHSIFGKLGVSNRPQAIVRAHQMGLFEGPL